MISQLLDDIVRTRQRLHNSTFHLQCMFINVMFATSIYLDINYGGIIQKIDAHVPFLKFIFIMECLKGLFMFNAVFNLYKYSCNSSVKHPLKVHPVIQKLCGIKDNEPGFVTSTPTNKSFKEKRETLPIPVYSPSNYEFLASSFLECSYPSDLLFHTSFSPLRHRRKEDIHNSLPLNLSDVVNTSVDAGGALDDSRSLLSFLHDQKKKETNMLQMETAMQRSAYRDGLSPPYLSSSAHHSVLSQVSGHEVTMHYDLAKPLQGTSAHSPMSPCKTDSLLSFDVWTKFGVSNHMLDLWTERLRKYLKQSILTRVVEEVKLVNRSLVVLGMEENLIGSISLAALKQLQSTKGHLLPKLGELIPFLQLSNNQQYLVARIFELNEGACMSCFRWNSGGTFKEQKWQDNLPTDAAILMHLLCSYLDSCLPSIPSFSSEGSFTGQHFIKKTDKAVDMSQHKDSVYLQEVSINPPVYDVIHNSQKMNIKKGRDNFFQSTLLFFYLIKTKEHGLLRRLSLGLNGINLLWIFDN